MQDQRLEKPPQTKKQRSSLMSQHQETSAAFPEAHVNRCQQVLHGDLALGAVVHDLRQSVAAQEDLRSRTELLRGLASKERKPFKLAAMRAIDRVLPATAEGTPASKLATNASLRNFVSVVTPNIRLRARAGAGKSTAIVIKCDFLIRELGIAPETIQVLTFNKKAAEDLSAKMVEALGPEVGKRVGVNTFHSLAFHVLRRAPATAQMSLNFKADDAELSADGHTEASLMFRAQKAATRSQDIRMYKQRYEGTRHAYMAERDDFEDSLRGLTLKAASLLRARRGTPGGLRRTPVTAHLARVVDDYEARLEKAQSLDGQSGLRKAADILSSDQPLEGFKRLNGNLQYLFVDEYQDFSAAFEALVQGVMTRNPTCVLNAVGDDWQSINGFMGAAPVFFETFRKRYPASLHLPLQVNWRCGQRIVALGNEVMEATASEEAVAGLPHAGKIRVKVGGIVVHRYNKAAWQEDARDFLKRQLVNTAGLAWADDARAGRDPGTMVLLAAKRKPFGRDLLAYAAHIEEAHGVRVATSTCHSAKGLQWDHVILLDGIATEYPAAHPADPIQRDLIPKVDRDAESHRLLYVAVTRAKQTLTLLAPTELHDRLKPAFAFAKT